MKETKHFAQTVLDMAADLGWMVATAESCTGGMVSSALVDPAGSSKAFTGGFVTYSNQMKINILGVDSTIIDTYGAVSEQTVKAMVSGALNKSNADLAVSVSGIAGPGNTGTDKPVGFICFAVQAKGDATARYAENIFSGDRTSIRQQATEYALNLLIERIKQEQHG